MSDYDPRDYELLEEEREMVREHLEFNFYPIGKANHLDNVRVACLAIEMYLSGQRKEPVPGGKGHCPGEVISNLHLESFVHQCCWCDDSDPCGESLQTTTLRDERACLSPIPPFVEVGECPQGAALSRLQRPSTADRGALVKPADTDPTAAW